MTRASPLPSLNEASANAAPAEAAHHEAAHQTEGEQISQNLNAVLDFYKREDDKISYWQRLLEDFSSVIGQPAFLGFSLLFVVLWALCDMALGWLGWVEFDPPPFFWLQGMVGLAALLTTTIVLIKQNRLAKLEEQRAHLDLKVTLLTEQKAAKLIDLMEELRRDLPNVKNRHDPQSEVLQQAMNPDLVLAALDELATPLDAADQT
jgi:uncharacterized membrane protein